MNRLAFGILIILSLIMLYLSIKPKPYFFGHWIPVELLKSMGIPNNLIRLSIIKSDAIAHFFGAYTITILMELSFKGFLIKNLLKSQIILVLTMTSIFITIELIQLFVGRSFSLIDILAGTLGVLLSTLCFSIFAKSQPIMTKVD